MCEMIKSISFVAHLCCSTQIYAYPFESAFHRCSKYSSELCVLFDICARSKSYNHVTSLGRLYQINELHFIRRTIYVKQILSHFHKMYFNLNFTACMVYMLVLVLVSNFKCEHVYMCVLCVFVSCGYGIARELVSTLFLLFEFHAHRIETRLNFP